MTDTNASLEDQAPKRIGVVDWDAKPEPWRSTGKAFLADLDRIMAGYVRPPPPSIPQLKRVLSRPAVMVRILRRQKRMSQAALAARAGVTQAMISLVERGQTDNPYRKTKRGIARALGVPVSDIWPG